jgi:hypothetical protein
MRMPLCITELSMRDMAPNSMNVLESRCLSQALWKAHKHTMCFATRLRNLLHSTILYCSKEPLPCVLLCR